MASSTTPTPLHTLLLLPDGPQLPTSDNIDLALFTPLQAAISKVVKLKLAAPASLSSTVLDIALPITRLANTSDSRTRSFTLVQNTLNGIYSILAGIFKREDYATEGPSGIDVRVVLIYDPKETPTPASPTIGAQRKDDNTAESVPCGTISFKTLAESKRPWKHVLVVQSKPGEQVFHRFRSIAAGDLGDRLGPYWDVHRIPGGIQMYLPPSGSFFSSFQTDQSAYENVPTCSSALVRIDVESEQVLSFTAKYMMTMGLLLLSPRSDLPEGAPEPTHNLFVALFDGFGKKPPNLQRAWSQPILSFLTALLHFSPKQKHRIDESIYPTEKRSDFIVTTLEREDGLKVFAADVELLMDEEVAKDVEALVLGSSFGEDLQVANREWVSRGWREKRELVVGGVEGEKRRGRVDSVVEV